MNLFLALTVTARSVPILSRHCCPHNQSGCKFQPLANNESRLPGVVAFQELNFSVVPLKADDKDPHSVSYPEGAAILEQMLISLAIFRRYCRGKCSKSLDISTNSDRSPVIGQIRCRSSRDRRSNALCEWNWIIRLGALFKINSAIPALRSKMADRDRGKTFCILRPRKILLRHSV